MKHLIYTRCDFINDDLFQDYFKIMRRTYIPSIKSQTNKDFELFIYTNPIKDNHRRVIKEEFIDSGINLKFDIFGFSGYCIGKNINIQSRIDCDDWVGPTYVEKIQKLYSYWIGVYDEFLIHAQPTKLDFNSGGEYSTKPYNSSRPSMFLSLCQKQVSKNILQAPHVEFSKLVPMVFDLGGGYVKLVVHGNNSLSKIEKDDIEII